MQSSAVLIVEQDDRVCRVLSRIIKHLGYVPCPATDYKNFKSLYDEQNPAAILLDLESSGNDHAEFFRFLAEQHSTALIILLSDLDEIESNEFIRLGRDAGLNMRGLLHKPLDVELVKGLLVTAS